jgi:hypothetical protein
MGGCNALSAGPIRKRTSEMRNGVCRLVFIPGVDRNRGDAVMKLIDDLGNAISRVATDVGQVLTMLVTAMVSSVETIAGLFRRLSW